MRKIIILFIFISNYGFAQSTLSKTIDFSAHNISIGEALSQLSEIAGIDIAFSNNFFKKQAPINVDFKNESIEEILQSLLSESKITYKQLGNRIVLVKKKITYHTISGYLEDKASGERLIAANIFCPKLQKGTITNEYGFYSLTLPKGDIKLIYSYLGYAQSTEKIQLNQSVQYNIQLDNSITLTEVIVTPKDNNSSTMESPNDLSASNISKEIIEISPDLGGESDPIRTAQLLSGIQSGADGLGGIYVRGGNSGHNLMLMDGVTVYVPYHLLGLFSIYNSNIVKSAKVIKGSFPARCPIKKGKGAILLSGRRSHSGFLLNPFFKRTFFGTASETLTTDFYDVNLKLNYTLSPKDRIYFSYYTGNDGMESYAEEEEDTLEEEEVELAWSNTIAALRWNHLYNDKLFSNTTFTYSLFSYDYTVLEQFRDFDENRLEELYFINTRSLNNDIGLKIDFDYLPSSSHKIRFGAGIETRQFNPELTYIEEDDVEFDVFEEGEDLEIDDFNQFKNETYIEALEGFIYFEDQINIRNKCLIDIGIRASSFSTKEDNYFNIEPRISANYKINNQFTLSSSISRMVQYLHLVSFSTVRLPNDLWVPSGEGLLPEESWQSELGLIFQTNASTSIGLNAYYKKLDNLYSYPDGYNFEIEDFREFLTVGEGEARGLELTIKHDGKRTGGLFSYTRSETIRQFDDVNEGESFQHAYNQPHQIKLFLYHKIDQQFHLGLNWVYNSPSPVLSLVPFGSSQLEENIDIDNPGFLDRSQNVDYHRLDISGTYHFTTNRLEHTIKLGAYNVYNRKNITYARVNFDEDDNKYLREIFALPIQPSFSYKIKF